MRFVNLFKNTSFGIFLILNIFLCNPVKSENHKINKDSCENVNIKDCFNLGVLEHKKGNISKAQNLYTKACNGGDVKSCTNLGALESKKGNTSKAQNLYTKACNGGIMKGCFNLGALEYKKG